MGVSGEDSPANTETNTNAHACSHGRNAPTRTTDASTNNPARIIYVHPWLVHRDEPFEHGAELAKHHRGARRGARSHR